MNKNLCIIPARGGSKRIPGKNIKNFLGKPIIAYSIEAALKSRLFDEIVVSTDSEKIAKVSKKFGASVQMRSLKNSDDHAVLADVIDEVKEYYLDQKRSFEYICCLLPTAPLVHTSQVKRGLNHLMANPDLYSIKPIVRFNYPIERAFHFDDSTKVVQMIMPEHKFTRSQDLRPTYHDAGSFYWIRFNCDLRKEPKGGFEINSLYTQDIDNEEDWEIAEFKYEFLLKKGYL